MDVALKTEVRESGIGPWVELWFECEKGQIPIASIAVNPHRRKELEVTALEIVADALRKVIDPD